MQHDRGKADAGRQRRASGGAPEVARSITIGKPADELRRRWLEPTTLPQTMAGFATVHELGDGRMHWKVDGPIGLAFEWDTDTVEDDPGGSIGWRALANAPIPNEGRVRFQPAQGDRGTVVTLQVRFAPPGGSLSDAAVKFLGTTPLELMADRALLRFKSLVETGEIPTTERQPAARADTH